MVLSAVSLVFWLLIIPYSISCLFEGVMRGRMENLGARFIAGFLLEMAAFEVIAIFCTIKITYNAFTYCTWAFAITCVLMAMCGIIHHVRYCKKNQLKLFYDFTVKKFLEMPKWDQVFWLIVAALLIVQLVCAVRYATFDGDDAYYVVQSLLAQNADAMSTMNPYMGGTTALDVRHALAVVTMWVAFIARMSGVHATILSHNIIPLFVIPFVALVYYQFAKLLFGRDKKDMIPIFMIIVELLFMFGNVSIYTPATFLLMRTWQGKAMASNICLPLIVLTFFWIFLDEKDKVDIQKTGISIGIYENEHGKCFSSAHTPWIFLTLINMFCGACTSMIVIYGGGLAALFTLILIVRYRSLKFVVPAIMSQIPSVIYLMLYLSVI